MKLSHISLSASLLLVPGPALAHFGHLGEVAGHGHILGWGALAAAAALAAALARRGKPKKENDESEPEPAEEAETA